MRLETPWLPPLFRHLGVLPRAIAAVHPYFLYLLPAEDAPGFISLSRGKREQGSEGRRDRDGLCDVEETWLLIWSLLKSLVCWGFSLSQADLLALSLSCKTHGQMRPLKWEHVAMVTSSQVQTGFMKIRTFRFCSLVNTWSFLFIFHPYPVGHGAWFWIHTVQWFICCLNLCRGTFVIHGREDDCSFTRRRWCVKKDVQHWYHFVWPARSWKAKFQ